MEGFNNSRTNRSRKKPNRSKHLISIFILFLIFFFFLFFIFNNSTFTFTFNFNFFPNNRCLNLQKTLTPHKFLWYAPHSGFSNQLSEFKNALIMAAILNRTLILPPLLDHHAVVLGSCPKFRVSDPNDLRFSVWNHAIQLIQSHRYVSMADVIDLSSLVSDSAVRVIDFRYFASLFCDIDVNDFCVKDSRMEDSLLEKLKQCGSLLSGYNSDVNDCVYAVQEDCRTTVWTYQKNGEDDGSLDSFQPDEQLKKKKKISFVRRRKDVYATLGPRSRADLATILSFGKAYALHTVMSPFLCAQLRLLDGQFKNHRTATFQGLKQKLDSLKQKESLPSALTGESLPVTKNPGDGVYSGSTCKQGEIEAVVIATSVYTLFGKAAHLVDSTTHISHFQQVLTAIGNFCICSIAIGMIYAVSITIRIVHKCPFDEDVWKARLASAIYLQVSTISQALIFVTRSRGWSFMERPGLLLLAAFILAQLFATVMSAYLSWGFAKVHAIGWVTRGHVIDRKTAFSTQKDFGREAREVAWAKEQRTLHGLDTSEAKKFTGNYTFRDINMMAEEAKRRAEIARLRELHTLKGKVESFAKLRGLDIDVNPHYTL
ncbi:hypothetical protein M8C21_012989 [Ambrosia artemisiifolia]|uniref:P-type ATPase A domain-containing protein n=1 Tax=Ambrosia artemisiifolia TaxID=4212 RepID=A0AAD5BSZ6_AMBAR|nr:hypothetical protein M8C21_012989 [Ambrosia artemisiifolia]